jgi:hypothetical protein
MFGTFCFLWRHHPAKIAALTMMLPSFGLAMFMDGYPEIGRRAASLTLFVLGVSGVALLQAGIAFNRMQVEDRSFELIPGHPTTVTAIASGAILCILTFSLKKLCASLWKPGSLVVMKDNLRSLLLPPHALHLARTAHTLLALHSAKHNASLKRQLEASSSGRKSIIGSMLSPAHLSALDSLPISTTLEVRPPSAWAAPPDSEPRVDEIRIGIVPLVDTRPQSDADPPTDASHGDHDKATVCAIASGLLRECKHLQRAMRDLPLGGSVATTGGLAAQIRDARGKALEVVDEAIAIANLTHSSVDSAACSLWHVPSERPQQVCNEETLAPRVSAFLIQHRRLRFMVKILANLVTVFGIAAAVSMYFDARSDVWLGVVTCGTLPIILLNALAFNRTLLKGIITSSKPPSCLATRQ